MLGANMLKTHYKTAHYIEWRKWADGIFLTRNMLANMEKEWLGKTNLLEFN